MNYVILGLNNGVSLVRHQASIWTYDDIVNETVGNKYQWNLNWKIQQFSYKKTNVKMSYAKSRPFCIRLYLLNVKWPLPFSVPYIVNQADIHWQTSRVLQQFSYKKTNVKMSYAKSRPFCVRLYSLNVKWPLPFSVPYIANQADIHWQTSRVLLGKFDWVGWYVIIFLCVWFLIRLAVVSYRGKKVRTAAFPAVRSVNKSRK